MYIYIGTLYKQCWQTNEIKCHDGIYIHRQIKQTFYSTVGLRDASFREDKYRSEEGRNHRGEGPGKGSGRIGNSSIYVLLGERRKSNIMCPDEQIRNRRFSLSFTKCIAVVLIGIRLQIGFTCRTYANEVILFLSIVFTAYVFRKRLHLGVNVPFSCQNKICVVYTIMLLLLPIRILSIYIILNHWV